MVSGETLVRKLLLTSAITLFTRLKCWFALQHKELVAVSGPGLVSMPDMTRSIWMISKMSNSNLTGLEVFIKHLLPILSRFVGWWGKAKGRQLCCLMASCEEVAAEITPCKQLAVDNQSAERAKNRKSSCQTCNKTQKVSWLLALHWKQSLG